MSSPEAQERTGPGSPRTQTVTFALPRSRLRLHGLRAGGGGGGTPTLCLHGWRDNCASFSPMIEALNELDLISIDLPGHGMSDPIPSLTCNFVDYAMSVIELVTSQDWHSVRLIGHSVGASLAALIAGTFPEKVSGLVLIEPVLPCPVEPIDMHIALARYFHAYIRPRNPVRYRSRKDAVRTRVQFSDLLAASAEALADRELCYEPDGLRLHQDPRLRLPIMPSFTKEQFLRCFARITAPALLVTAENSLLFHDIHAELNRMIGELTHVTLPGGHHLHMESELVATTIKGFLDVLTDGERNGAGIHAERS